VLVNRGVVEVRDRIKCVAILFTCHGVIEVALWLRAPPSGGAAPTWLLDGTAFYVAAAVLLGALAAWGASRGALLRAAAVLAAPAMLLRLPTLLGAALTQILRLAVPGARLEFGALALGVSIRDARLHVDVRVDYFGFGNPPGYPHRDFVSAEHVCIGLAAPLKMLWQGVHVSRVFARGGATWSPFPSVAAAKAATPRFNALRFGVLQV
jgi:hypothetical protein